MKLIGASVYDIDFLRSKMEDLKSLNIDITISIETISNLTGHETNWTEVLKVAEEYDARVILDNAQGACFIDVNLSVYKNDIYVGVSGHKMGARDGSAVLVGPESIFKTASPLDPTGGMVFHYTEDKEFFMPAPSTLEPGTPNYISQASLGEVFKIINCVGKDKIKDELSSISLYLERKLSKIKNIKIYGDIGKKRYGPLPFVLYTDEGKEIPSMGIAACLSYFYGIQLRANHHCAPVLVHALKNISNRDANIIASQAQTGVADGDDIHRISRHLQQPEDLHSALHMVRPSVSYSTTREEIDFLYNALVEILENKKYENIKFVQNIELGFNEYTPKGFKREVVSPLLYPDVSFEGIVSISEQNFALEGEFYRGVKIENGIEDGDLL